MFPRRPIAYLISNRWRVRHIWRQAAAMGLDIVIKRQKTVLRVSSGTQKCLMRQLDRLPAIKRHVACQIIQPSQISDRDAFAKLRDLFPAIACADDDNRIIFVIARICRRKRPRAHRLISIAGPGIIPASTTARPEGEPAIIGIVIWIELQFDRSKTPSRAKIIAEFTIRAKTVGSLFVSLHDFLPVLRDPPNAILGTNQEHLL